MKKWGVVVVLAAAQFVMVLDSTVMNVSISQIVQDLGTTVSALQTAITFYALTMASLMLIGAKLCNKWGLMRAFTIGSVIYGIGSLITALSPNVTTLFIGWSVIEGLGAVLVIPAVTAIIALSYKGKERVTAYAIIGGVSGMAAAAGPLIGGFMTTYLSWRYVFVAETIVMVVVLFKAKSFKVNAPPQKGKLDIQSALLSASGLLLIVYGMLLSKTLGWVSPMQIPNIGGYDIAPFGVSIVTYMILTGIVIIKFFFDRQTMLEANPQGEPLLKVSLLKSKQLRATLSVLSSQYVITAATFFVIPIYLQISQGLNALQTGIKIMPLSIALIVASVIGSKLINRYTPKQIVRAGQILMVAGVVVLLAAIDPELTSVALSVSLALLGFGLGLLASQLANVAIDAAGSQNSSEVGGMTGTFQNLGSSLGTALIGSVMVASLTTGFVSNINTSTLPDSIKTYITQQYQTGVSIVSPSDVTAYAQSQGIDTQTATDIADTYSQSQLVSLKRSIFFLAVIAAMSLLLSKHIPNKKVA
ncbi:MFS transporter [bacterium]|nr:MFS transporter [bacterium]NBX97911.1 MFS transporter [bacterium]NDC93849.1 MFS transporter [bacterium]NDD82796.1 MFS transporter [bacterium]NDG30088.1 MFS transporter [bacterium]